jgi:hypothetical protein
MTHNEGTLDRAVPIVLGLVGVLLGIYLIR